MHYLCPNCKSRNIGKIGSHHYYCWDCFIEFGVQGELMMLYEVEEDGSLISLDDLFSESERHVSHHLY
ncbi:MAG: hypothetical protein BAA01_01070 [Bacillus thermozeamaize]|jgi:hypothetical protein|uniref:Uncharacterized protein n=1 Tax=Bacillus thermozeamaize TaxID=230954 RepID=A0A1Y3PN31_9BACI|nr:MAG: hypothetical protein BAA01_01070 [Bacillus thermozeamaize]